MSTKGSKRILLESLKIDEQDITLGVIRQKVLHHAEDSLRDLRTFPQIFKAPTEDDRFQN